MALLTPPADSLTLPGSILQTSDPSQVPTLSTSPINSFTPTSSPPSTPSPYLYFLPLPTLTACGEYTIIWEASGDITNLAITVTDHSLNSPLSPQAELALRQTTSHSTNSTFTEVIATGLNPTSNVFFWNPIAVPAGTYVLVGTLNGLTSPSYSSQFSVANGSDTSCLNGSTSLPSSASSSASSSNSHLAGAIAGGVIGGLALMAILIALFLFWRAYRSARRGPRNPAGHGTMRSWKGLSSRDSTFPRVLPTYNKNNNIIINKSYRGQGQTESTGKIFSANNSSIGHGACSSPSPVGSAEDVSTLATADGVEKASSKFHSRGSFDYIDTISPLSYHPRRRSSITVSTTPTISPTGNTIGSNYSPSQHRSTALAKLEFSAPPGNCSPTATTTPISRTPSYTRHYQQRQSLDGRVLSSPLDTHVAHLAAEITPINRSASGGRRANRKPVPTYDAAALEDGSPTLTLASPVSSTTLDRSNSSSSTRGGSAIASIGFGAGVKAPGMYSNPRGNPSAGSGSGVGGNGNGNSNYGTPVGGRSMEDFTRFAGGLELPSLNHKSSFGGGGPVHYLIPDMPPPQKD